MDEEKFREIFDDVMEALYKHTDKAEEAAGILTFCLVCLFINRCKDNSKDLLLEVVGNCCDTYSQGIRND